MGKNIKKPAMTKTERGLNTILEDMWKSLHRVRQNDGDLVALQCVTFMFSGNPAIIFSHDNLLKICCNIANAVRDKAIVKFKAYGSDGPEAMSRMLGDDKTWCEAANQALLRFQQFIDETARLRDAIAQEEAARAAAGSAPGTIVPSPRMAELVALSQERELTPEESAELDEYRKGLRGTIAAVKTPSSGPDHGTGEQESP